MGFYVAREPSVPIPSVRVAADVPPAERTPLEVLRTDSATFRSVLEQRRNRHDVVQVQSRTYRSLQRAAASSPVRRPLAAPVQITARRYDVETIQRPKLTFRIDS